MQTNFFRTENPVNVQLCFSKDWLFPHEFQEPFRFNRFFHATEKGTKQ